MLTGEVYLKDGYKLCNYLREFYLTELIKEKLPIVIKEDIEKMNNILTNEHTISYHPRLAEAIGHNESLILSLVHYFLHPKYNHNFKNNKYWVYNSYEEWRKKIPALSLITIRRAINKLEKLGVLVSDKLKSTK